MPIRVDKAYIVCLYGESYGYSYINDITMSIAIFQRNTIYIYIYIYIYVCLCVYLYKCVYVYVYVYVYVCVYIYIYIMYA